VAEAEGFEGLEEGGVGVDVVQLREPAVAAEGEEVVVALRLVTLRTARHGGIVGLWALPRSSGKSAHEWTPRRCMRGSPPSANFDVVLNCALNVTVEAHKDRIHCFRFP
jgi:hypothetical protein